MSKTLNELLQVFLQIQKLDLSMIRLMQLKMERLKELQHIHDLRLELKKQLAEKATEISTLNRDIATHESKLTEIKEKIKKYESRQVKTVHEYQAHIQEKTQADRELRATELICDELTNKRNLEEEFHNKIQESLQQSEESSAALESEIKDRIQAINVEGKELQTQRLSLEKTADPEIREKYELLLSNKKDAVIVPIESKTCSGCHISLTKQHEISVANALAAPIDAGTRNNAERLQVCEHCGRIHILMEAEVVPEGTEEAPKRRRRRAVTV